MKHFTKTLGITLLTASIFALVAMSLTTCSQPTDSGGGGAPSKPVTPSMPTTPITPDPPSGIAVTGVSLNKASTTLLVGDTETLTPAITPANATNQNVMWSNSNIYVATASDAGTVTAAGVGTATITVTTASGGKTASCTVSVNPVTVTGVTLDKTSTSILEGNTETLYAIIAPANATNKNVTWSSGNTGVATVSEDGLVTAVSAGSTTITVKTEDGNKIAACTVSVSPITISVTGITLNKTSTAILVGGTETLTATIAPSNATNQNVTWSSGNETVATVSQAGIVTAVSVGSAAITVTTGDGGKTAACTVTVNPVAVTGVTMNKATTTILINGTETLYATIAPANATNKNVTWSSSDTTVATVSTGGVVTAKGVGKTTITVSTVDGNKKATCNVTVDTYTFYSIVAFIAWLDAQPTNTAATAYKVKIKMSEVVYSTSSVSLGNALYYTNKYISLDLSGSTFTSIGDYAFMSCSSLTSVTIPNIRKTARFT